MNTLICDKPGSFSYKQSAPPVPEPGQTILQIKRIGICGTDLHAFEGTQPFFSYPRILGHELAADIVSGDQMDGFEENEPVTFIPYFHCGKCLACRTGLTNCCEQIKVCGVHIDGGMVEYLSVPSSSLVHGRGLIYDQLALVEPLAIGCHGVKRAAVKEGENVLVVGAGPIGLGVMEFARIAGGTVTALDINAERLEFCKGELGVRHVINATDDHALESMREITNGEMYSVVIDATGSLRAINGSFAYLAHGGRYVLVGLQKNEIVFSHPEFHKREATLMSSRNASREDFDFVINCLVDKQIDVDKFITHRVRFMDVANEFGSWLKPEKGVIKAMVEM